MEISELYKLFKEHPVVCTDTRKITKNSIFFALKGDNFNGNLFAKSALDLGAAYAIVDEVEVATQPNIIYVKDVLVALQELANYHRKQFNIPLVAITGSNGKTTTKELIYAVLSKKYKTVATVGNLNNHIGVPLTILSITNHCEFAIIEMGANHPKEIEFLCTIAEPNFGIITNIGKAHIEGFGSFEGVIKTKSELYNFIKLNKGTLFVNKDDELLVGLSKGINTVFYGTSSDFCNATLLSSTPASTPVLELEWKGSRIKTQLYGTYNFTNIVAAICIGTYFKVDDYKIIEAISEYTSTNNRSQLVKWRANLFYLDAYNANPSSMHVAIDTFIEIKEQNKLMILGDMLELGAISETEHQQIIDKVLRSKIKTLFVGKNFGALGTNYQTNLILFYENYKQAAEWIKNENISNFNILIKGSRGIQLEKIVEILKED
ncbi:MAG: UDP-N-acetylmuramoyl-tripeptide--D-alanyl-D-alanine ligase [Vicingaceae bacterium]|nr:UDP-N-acetylmuramoyl-tripeptide--D-alanyl-D-alanine ligase [Vicingaceae bacterium]